MTHNIRRTRRTRRRKRHDQESRTLWMYATVTLMSLASLLVSMGKVLFKLSEDLIGPLSLFLMASGVIAFGLVVLWGLYQRGSRLTTTALAIGALLTVTGGVFIGGKGQTTDLRWVDPQNPWELNLPRVEHASTSHDPHLVLVVGEKQAALGRYGAIRSETEALAFELPDEGFRATVEEATERVARELRILNLQTDIRVAISADQCTQFGRFFDFQLPLLKSGTVIELAVNSPQMTGYLRLPAGGDAGHQDGTVVTLMPDRIKVQPAGAPLQLVECLEKDCFSDSCDQAQDFSRLVELIPKTTETYVLRVHPEVSVQSMTSLVDSVVSGHGAYASQITPI